MVIRNLSIGADPEFFLIKEGNPQSAVGLIGGSKQEPKPIANGCAVLEDNVMVEFNTPPTKNHTEMADSVNYVMDYVLEHVKKELGNGVDISKSSSLVFPTEQLQNEQACEFGCDPDFNIWEGGMNQPPDAGLNNRYAGGHIHLGFERDDDFIENAFNLVKYLDFAVGIPSVVQDKGVERRSLYGKAGTFRIKDYGVEYRSPSNYWIFSNEEIKNIFGRIEHAIDLYEKGFNIDEHEDIIRDTINNSKVNQAKEICEKYSLL